jgi:hypothetical protein
MRPIKRISTKAIEAAARVPTGLASRREGWPGTISALGFGHQP